MNQSNVVYPNLRAEMARKNLTIDAVAKFMRKNRDTISRKLTGKTPIHLDEAFKIAKHFFPELDPVYLYATRDSTEEVN